MTTHFNMVPASPTSLATKGLAKVSTVTTAVASSDSNHLANLMHSTSTMMVDQLERKKNLYEKMFPNQLDKLLSDVELKKAHTVADFNQRIMTLACNARFEELREKSEAWIKTVRLDIRAEFADFAAERLLQLEKTIESKRIEFLGEIEQRYIELDKLAHLPKLHQKYEESIDRSVERSILFLDNLLEQMTEAITSRLSDYEVPTLKIG